MASDFSDTGDPTTDTFFVATAGEYDPVEYLNPGVTVTGNIYAPDGSTPSTDANYVNLYRQTYDPVLGTYWEIYSEISINTGTQSTYSIPGLSPGTYIAEAEQTDQPTWAENGYDVGGT